MNVKHLVSCYVKVEQFYQKVVFQLSAIKNLN